MTLNNLTPFLETGLGKMYNMDSFKFLKGVPSDSIDCLLTDPPYAIELKAQRSTSKFKNDLVINDDNLFWLDEWCSDIYRICKNVGFIFGGWQCIGEFQFALKRVGFEIKNLIIWDKQWFGLGNNFRPQYEVIFLVTKSSFKTKSNNIANVVKYTRMNPESMIHICEKPVGLLEILLNESTNEGDLVLDCFLGSGATAVACEKLKRKWIGVELDNEHCIKASERISKYSKVNEQADNFMDCTL